MTPHGERLTSASSGRPTVAADAARWLALVCQLLLGDCDCGTVSRRNQLCIDSYQVKRLRR